MSELGGDFPVNTQLDITVKVVATGLGNQEPGGGGACCTGLDPSGPRPFFDVKHPHWDIAGPPGIATWSVQINKEKVAAHEYTHGWQYALGGLSFTSRERLVDWLTEGMAEYVAYATMIRLGDMRPGDVDAFMLSSARVTGQLRAAWLPLKTAALRSGTGPYWLHRGQVVGRTQPKRNALSTDRQ